MIDEDPGTAEPREAWKVLSAASVGFGAGVAMFITTAGLFIKPMQDEFGWSTAALTIGPIVHVTFAVCSPLAGRLVDRWGARRIAIIGLLLFALAVGSLSIVPRDRTALYLFAIAVGFVGPLTSTASFFKGVATWFVKRPGTAFGITATGSSLVSLVAIPLVSASIYHFGWRSGYLTLSGITLLLALPPVLLFFREREAPISDDAGSSAGPGIAPGSGISLGEAFRTPQYWVLLLAIGVGSAAAGGFLVHLMPILSGSGFSVTATTALGVVFAASVAIGRIAGGFLLDRYDPGKIAASMLSAAALGAILLTFVTPASPIVIAALAAAIIGMGQGVEADFIAYFALRLFGLKFYSTILSTTTMIGAIAMAIGGSAFAFCRDFTGSYHLAIQAGAGCYAMAGLAFFICHRIGNARPAVPADRIDPSDRSGLPEASMTHADV